MYRESGFGSVLDDILSQEHKIDGKIVDVKRAVPKSEAPGPSSRYDRFCYFHRDAAVFLLVYNIDGAFAETGRLPAIERKMK